MHTGKRIKLFPIGGMRLKKQRVKKGKHKRSAKTKSIKRTSLLTPLRPSASISSSSKWYRDCRIELDRFLDALYEKDYRRLIIEGSVPEEVLKEAWRTIYAQYCELTQEGTYNELLDKSMQIQELNARIALLEGIIQQLQWSYDPLLVRLVNEMAIPLQLTADEDPYKKLKQVQGRVKRMLFELGKLEKEIEVLQSSHQHGSGVEVFEDWLAAMSRHFQYAVKAKDISVLQFVKNQKLLQKQFEKQQDGTRKD